VDVATEPLIYREEVTAILGVLGDLNVHVRRILDLFESEFDGEEGWKKTTPQERARWLANHQRLERLLARRLTHEGVSREEAIRRLQDAK
jgi:hypothetical protein